jgi:hypothetical protein
VNIFAIRTAIAAMCFIAGSAVAGNINSASQNDAAPGNIVGTFDKAGSGKGNWAGNDVSNNSQLDLVLTLNERGGRDVITPGGKFGKIAPASAVIVDVPEPATPLTVALGLALVALMARRRRNAV